jgi:hypothetical protein
MIVAATFTHQCDQSLHLDIWKTPVKLQLFLNAWIMVKMYLKVIFFKFVYIFVAGITNAICLKSASDILRSKMSRRKQNNYHFDQSEMPNKFPRGQYFFE